MYSSQTAKGPFSISISMSKAILSSIALSNAILSSKFSGTSVVSALSVVATLGDIRQLNNLDDQVFVVGVMMDQVKSQTGLRAVHNMGAWLKDIIE